MAVDIDKETSNLPSTKSKSTGSEHPIQLAHRLESMSTYLSRIVGSRSAPMVRFGARDLLLPIDGD